LVFSPVHTPFKRTRVQPDLNIFTTMDSKNNSTIKVAIAGASGRMGKMLIEAVHAAPDMRLTAALDRVGTPLLGFDAGLTLGLQTGVLLSSDVAQAMAHADVLIDFTRPEGTLEHLSICQQLGKKIIIGTTGFDAVGKAAIATAAQSTAVVFSANMSVGVNVTLKLLELAAAHLQHDYDIEIFEAHHKHKVDAPSGTALAMGDAVAAAMNQSLNDIADWARHGNTGVREKGKIGFSVMRGGDIIGDHIVCFAGEGERVEISHRSSSRATYAQGSLKAVRFLANKTVGLFNMQDVLGL
jgi:4-hydroxy-tetrahydrodipicolinate reductase